MAARNSNKAHASTLVRGAAHKERRPAPIFPRTHSKTRPEGDVLEGLSRSISLVETIAVAMQTHEDDVDLGPIAEALEMACNHLRQAHSATSRSVWRQGHERQEGQPSAKTEAQVQQTVLRLSSEDIETAKLSLIGVLATCELVRSSASRSAVIVLTRGALKPLHETLKLLGEKDPDLARFQPHREALNYGECHEATR